MSYIKNNWQDRVDNADDDYLVDGERKTIKKYDEEVVQSGTPFEASKLNKIEQGIEDAHDYFYITDTDTGTVYKCHEELRSGKPVLVYEEEV